MVIVYLVFLGITVVSMNCMTLLTKLDPDLIAANETEHLSRSRREDRKDIEVPRKLLSPKNASFDASSKSSYLRRRTDIVFPGPYNTEYPRIKIASLDAPPPCAGDSTFCESIETYPHQIVNDVLKYTKVNPEFFGEDETPVIISDRHSGEPEEKFLCGSFERTIFPKIAKTKNNKWKYIINQDDSKEYVQGVRIETCTTPGQPCDLIDAVPLGFVTTCKQKFVYRRLLSVTDSNEPVKDFFEMPSACCCSYKRDVTFLSNFGSLRKKKP